MKQQEFEVLEHFLRDQEVGDDAVFQGPDGGDVTGRAAQHAFRVQTHGGHGLVVVVVANCHHRGLIENDALVTHIDERVGRSQIYRQIAREQPTNVFEHQLLQVCFEEGCDFQIIPASVRNRLRRIA